MRFRLPQAIILILFFLLWATPSFALQKWGVHLSNDRDPGLVTALRQRYNQAGITDWVPLTVLLPVDIGSDELAGFLDGCKNNKFWPILRVFNDGQKILKHNVDELIPTLVSVQSRISGFPESIYLVFGNEVNNGENEWQTGNADPVEYTESLRYFIDQVRLKAPAFKVGNAALNTSMPSNLLPKNYPAEKFWKEGPASLANDLDAFIANTYELGTGVREASIGSWIWEMELIGIPEDKKVILTEYGYWPSGEPSERENYVNNKYRDYLNDLERGSANDLDRVTAITPLFWTSGAIKIPVFGMDGNVAWYDPDNIYSGEPATTPASANGTPAITPAAADGLQKYISQLLGKLKASSNTNRNVRNLACGQLPLALCDESGGVVSSNFNQNTSVLGVSDANVSQDTKTVVGVVQDYNTLAAIGENRSDYSSRNLENFFSNLYTQIMTLLGFGDVRAKRKMDSTVAVGIMNNNINMENAFVKGLQEELPVGIIEDVNPINITPTGIIISPQITLVPTQGTGPTLTYDIPFYKTDKQAFDEIDAIARNLISNMNIIVPAVKKKWPTSFIDHWQEVYEKALSQNWNPALVIAIWIEETAASDVCSLETQQIRNRGYATGILDFGVITLPSTRCSDRDEVKIAKFREQLRIFLNIVDKIDPPKTFEKFMCRYSEGHYPCSFDINPGFLSRLPTVYNCLINPSTTDCPKGYFLF